MHLRLPSATLHLPSATMGLDTHCHMYVCLCAHVLAQAALCFV